LAKTVNPVTVALRMAVIWIFGETSVARQRQAGVKLAGGNVSAPHPRCGLEGGRAFE
jgi:hypothetical protein